MGHKKHNPLLSPKNWWAHGSSLTMSLACSFYNQQVPQSICTEQWEFPQHGSLLLILTQRYIQVFCNICHLMSKPRTSSGISVLRIIHCITLYTLYSVSALSSKSKYSQNNARTSLPTPSLPVMPCSPFYFWCFTGTTPQSAALPHLINYIPYF